MRLLDLPARGTLLDIGGGTGRLSQYFSGTVDRVIVADESGGMLRQAQLKGSLILLRGRAERLPICDGSVERVVMIDALHHLEDQSLAVAEIARVLRPAGRVLIEEPDIDHFMIKLIALVEKALGMRSHFLRGEQILKLFQGFPLKTGLERRKGVLWVTGEKPM